MFKIPTYEEALEIAKSSNGMFYEKREIIDGREFAIFNYRLANYKDFKDERYFELRGITYDLESGRHFLSIHKFFNQNENELVSDELQGDLEVRIKLDGSLIQPIVIDDKVYYKTKGTFNSEQVKLINTKIRKEVIDKFVLDMYYNHNIMPLFELVSPFNQIVIQYDLTDLVLIQARKLDTGEYLNYNELKQLADNYRIPYVNLVEDNVTYNDLLKWKNEIIGEEGWIIWNGIQSPTSFRKIKTDWYLTLHRLITPDELVEHRIIQYILDETIDDVLQNLSQNSEKRKYIENIITIITNYFNRTIKELQSIYTLDKQLFNQSRKLFVDKYRNYKLFPILMKTIEQQEFNESYVEKLLKDYIKKNTNKLGKAQRFLNEIKEEVK